MRKAFAAAAAAGIVVLISAAIAGQQPAPQREGSYYGVRNVKKHTIDLDRSYPRMPLAPEDQIYARLDGPHIKQFVEELTAISRKSRDDGNRYWGRIAGTKYDDMAEAMVEAKFKQLGLDEVRRQYFDLPPQWFPLEWDLTATGSGQTFTPATVRPAARSTATPAAGLDLEPVWVGLGTASDFAGRNVKGKLVIIASMPTPSTVQHSASWDGALTRAAREGAAAVLVNLVVPGTNFDTQMNSSSQVPTFSIGTDDALKLRDLMERGPMRVKVKLITEMRSGLRDATVWGVLPGTTDEDIIVFAHHDAYFEGAMDNASGVATMLGLAEYYSKIPKAQRRRTIKFATTAGHHAGSLGTKWMHDNRAAFLAKTALLINCEHVSSTQAYMWAMPGLAGSDPVTLRAGIPRLLKSTNIDARRWWVYGSDLLASITLGAYRTFGVGVYGEMEVLGAGDLAHIDVDAPSIELIESHIYYHTDHDRPEVVPAQGIEAVARAYAKIIDTVNGHDRSKLQAAPVTSPTGIR